MNPELTGFLLGLLLGAAKVLAIATIGFGIAWWRARARIRTLEAELLESGDRVPPADRLAVIQQQIQLLADQQRMLADRLLPRTPDPSTDVPGTRNPPTASPRP